MTADYCFTAPKPMFFTFDRHWILPADSRARAKTGNNIAARIAIIAITTRSSISVNPCDRLIGLSISLQDVWISSANSTRELSSSAVILLSTSLSVATVRIGWAQACRAGRPLRESKKQKKP